MIATLQTEVLTVQQQIANQLRRELLNGQFQVGECLREEHLAERFGVSRGPIREVLRQLVQQGLLISKRNCGVSVAPPPSEAVRQILTSLRMTIETEALSKCYDGLGDEDFQHWRKLIERLRRACEDKDYGAIFERDFDFHRSLLIRGGLEELVPIWTQIITRARPLHEQSNLKVDDVLAPPFGPGPSSFLARKI